eukprot:4747933-Prymnesium_polylepis.1
MPPSSHGRRSTDTGPCAPRAPALRRNVVAGEQAEHFGERAERPGELSVLVPGERVLQDVSRCSDQHRVELLCCVAASEVFEYRVPCTPRQRFRAQHVPAARTGAAA